MPRTEKKIALSQLLNRVEKAGFKFSFEVQNQRCFKSKKTTGQMYVYVKKGRWAKDKYCRNILRQCGLTPDEVDDFIEGATS